MIVKIQNRRGGYTDYDPSKLLPGEFAVVQVGDPNTPTGKGVYLAITAGDVVRLATTEEIAAYTQQFDDMYQTTLQDAGVILDEAKLLISNYTGNLIVVDSISDMTDTSNLYLYNGSGEYKNYVYVYDPSQSAFVPLINYGMFADLSEQISQNASNIATNTSNIATNATNIATNTASINTNTTNIAANTTNIATNASNITENAINIAGLAAGVTNKIVKTTLSTTQIYANETASAYNNLSIPGLSDYMVVMVFVVCGNTRQRLVFVNGDANQQYMYTTEGDNKIRAGCYVDWEGERVRVRYLSLEGAYTYQNVYFTDVVGFIKQGAIDGSGSGDFDPYQPWYELLPYVTPEMFGAVGNGTTDDTEAMKLCFNFAKNIIFVPDKAYLISDTLTLRSGHHIDFNGAKIISTTAHLFFNFDTTGVYTEYDGWGNITLKNGTIIGGAISLFHAQNVLIDAMHFENCINDHFVEICACKDVTISNSRFTGMLNIPQSQLEYINIDPCAYSPFPHLDDSENSSYDGTPCKNIMVHDNIFKIGEGNYAYMTNGVGTHQAPSDLPLHENVQINDNVVSGSSNSAISLLGCTKSGAVGNRVSTAQSPFRVGYGDSNVIYGNTAEVSSLVALVNFWYPTTNVVIYENNIINSSGYDSSGWAIITGNIDGSTFNKLQEHYVAYAGGTEYTLPFNIGVFNKLILDFGSVGAGTYFKQTIGSFSGRGFQNGEVFPFFDYDTNAIRKQSITISGNKITSSVSIRNVCVAADFTKKFS